MHSNTRRAYGSIASAMDFLEKTMAMARREMNRTLPSLEKLCTEAGVSRMTMLRALHQLSDRGEIVVSPGRATIICDSGFRDPTYIGERVPKKHRTPRWQEVKLRIINDIVEGRFVGNGALPAIKVLALQYGTTYLTLKKALSAIQSDEWIQKKPRGYAIRRFESPNSNSSIIFISSYPSFTSIADSTSRSGEFWNVFESECTRLNLAIDFWHYYEQYNPDGTLKIPADLLGCLLGKDSVIGYVVFATGFMQSQLETIFTRLEKHGKPISVVDESGVLEFYSRKLPAARIYLVGYGRKSGMAMGRHLLENNHRRIAYFQLEKNARGVKDRGEGIEVVYGEAGMAGAVTWYCLPANGTMAHSAGPQNPPQALAALERTMDGFGNQYDHEERWTLREKHLVPFFDAIRSQKLIEPLFEKALTDTGITAWVGATDEIAIQALNFLKKKKIAVPNSISVAGFDDSVASIGRNLTSYNFNMAGVTRAILDHIMNGTLRWRSRDYACGLMDYPQVLKVRSTSGRRPARGGS